MRKITDTTNYTPGVAPVTDNQIHEAGFLYDANGNLISDGKKDFIYDELNQQIEVRAVTTSCAAAGDGSGSFESSANAGEGAIPHSTLCYGTGTLVEKNGYDGGGMRVVRETYDPVTSFPKRTIYARLGGSVVKEYTQEYRGPISPAPELSHEKAYIYGPLGLLATEELCTFNCKSDESAGLNVTRYYEYDHLGTIRAITNASGNLESTFDYEPFGLELKGTTASWTTDISSNTHRFTGHERDEEAGEDYMKARMYVLSTARFPQIDPKFGGAGDPQNWNPYIYVLNSPVGASDPTGTLPIPYGDKFAGGEMTATLGPGEGATGMLVSGSVGSLSSAAVSFLQSMGFTLTQIQNYVNNGVNATTQVVTLIPAGQPGSILQGPPAPEIMGKPGVSLEQSGPVVSQAILAIFQDAKNNDIADHLIVNSTVRTPEENVRIGGSPTSDHVTQNVNQKAGVDVHFYRRGQIVDRQVYEHLSSNPEILNSRGFGFQVIFHGHVGGKGLAEHFHLGWSNNRDSNRYTTERATSKEPAGYHTRSQYFYKPTKYSIDTIYKWDRP